MREFGFSVEGNAPDTKRPTTSVSLPPSSASSSSSSSGSKTPPESIQPGSGAPRWVPYHRTYAPPKPLFVKFQETTHRNWVRKTFQESGLSERSSKAVCKVSRCLKRARKCTQPGSRAPPSRTTPRPKQRFVKFQDSKSRDFVRLPLHRNLLWYRGGLVFEAHRLLFHAG